MKKINGDLTKVFFFSATYTEEVITTINGFIQSYEKFQIPKEALKLRGVKQFRLKVPNAKKIDFLKEIYISLESTQTMVFVNTKKEAENLKESLAK